MNRLLTLPVFMLLASVLTLGGPALPENRLAPLPASDVADGAGSIAHHASSDPGAGEPFGQAGPRASRAGETIPAGRSRVHLGSARIVPAEFKGPQRAVEALSGRKAQPLSLASADFDEDGVPDVVSGYRSGRRGLMVLQRGNVDAIYPNAPEAKERRRTGTFTEAEFLPEAHVLEIPAPPDFLGAGDLDADGHWDVVTASRSQPSLFWHRGDGRGGFGPAQILSLPGTPTAFTTGEINRRDGLEDVVVAIDGPGGPEALVFEAPEGALQRSPERFGLPAPATSLVLGPMDEEHGRDLLMATGDSLTLIHGRDRRLSITAPGTPAPPAVAERLHLPFRVASVAVGRFSGGRDRVVALLSEEGGLHVAPLAALLSSARAGAIPESILAPVMDSDRFAAGLRTVKASSGSGDDLLVKDAATGRLRLIPPAARSGKAPRGTATAPDTEAAALFSPIPVPFEGSPVAMLPMRLSPDGLDDLVGLSSGSSMLRILPTLDSETYEVINTNDSGSGSLRQAIEEANDNAGADLIRFAIPGTGLHQITLSTSLPEITDSLTIDGSTQPGFSGVPRIVLDGSMIPDSPFDPLIGLSFRAGFSVVRGLSIVGFVDAMGNSGEGLAVEGDDVRVEGNWIGIMEGFYFWNAVGIYLENGSAIVGGLVPAARNVISSNLREGIFSATADPVWIQGNYIGTDPSGTSAPMGNLTGVGSFMDDLILGGAVPGARNVISGNGTGVHFRRWPPALTEALILANFIGTDAAGLAALPNDNQGILLETFGDPLLVTVGGTTPAARNVISGNSQKGIVVAGSWAQVQGNYIGLGADGATPVPNSGGGIGLVRAEFDVTNNTIGGTTPGAGNVISGGSSGVLIRGGVLNTVAGNSIGTDVSRTLARPVHDGIWLDGGALDNVIGMPSGANVIAGNTGAGIVIHDTGANVITNNFIGVTPSGPTLGNAGHGIRLDDSDGNLIGSTDPANQNVIAHNGGAGIRTGGPGDTGNAILANAIYSNGELGIDLGQDGPNPNDPLDEDIGANELQNHPEITLAQTTGETVRVDGTLGSLPLGNFTVRVYASESCDPSGHGEGKFYLGSFMVSTDASGMGTFNETFVGVAGMGEAVTATASHLGNTSEFSACASVVGVPPAAVDKLMFSSSDTLGWESTAGASVYHLYVGTRATLPGLATQATDTCEVAALPETGGTLPPGAVPPPGQMFWFLVTAEGQYGEGPVQPGYPNERILTSTGPCGDSCAHDQCEVGVALQPACNPMAAFVCDADPKCCDPVAGAWDFKCVQEVRTVGRSLRCDESMGTCPHVLCDEGAPLPPGCDSPPLATSCTALVCQADPHCCQQAWDDACMATMVRVCGYNCV